MGKMVLLALFIVSPVWAVDYFEQWIRNRIASDYSRRLDNMNTNTALSFLISESGLGELDREIDLQKDLNHSLPLHPGKHRIRATRHNRPGDLDILWIRIEGPNQSKWDFRYLGNDEWVDEMIDLVSDYQTSYIEKGWRLYFQWGRPGLY